MCLVFEDETGDLKEISCLERLLSLYPETPECRIRVGVGGIFFSRLILNVLLWKDRDTLHEGVKKNSVKFL